MRAHGGAVADRARGDELREVAEVAAVGAHRRRRQLALDAQVVQKLLNRGVDRSASAPMRRIFVVPCAARAKFGRPGLRAAGATDARFARLAARAGCAAPAQTSPSSFWPAGGLDQRQLVDEPRQRPSDSFRNSCSARRAAMRSISRPGSATASCAEAPSPRIVCSTRWIARAARSSSKLAARRPGRPPASSARATAGCWASAAARPRRPTGCRRRSAPRCRPSKRQSSSPAAPRSGRRSA